MHGNLVVHRIMDDYSVQGRNSLVKKLLRFCTIRTYISDISLLYISFRLSKYFIVHSGKTIIYYFLVLLTL